VNRSLRYRFRRRGNRGLLVLVQVVVHESESARLGGVGIGFSPIYEVGPDPRGGLRREKQCRNVAGEGQDEL